MRLTTWQLVRERAHPLYHARRLPPVRALLALADVPVWMRLPGIPWPVRARLVSHLAYRMLPLGLEPSVAGLLQGACALFAPRSFWDVGANFGYYTWLLKASRPDLQALMVEPDPANQGLIMATLARTPLCGVELCRYAASDAAGTAPFARDPVSGATGTLERGEHRSSPPTLTLASPARRPGRRHGPAEGTRPPAKHGARAHGRAVLRRGPRALPGDGVGHPSPARGRGAGGEGSKRNTCIMVPTRPLDDERSARGPVDVLKIDVEGHEERVLRGARQILARDRPLVVVECFHTGLPAAQMLRQHRYVVVDAERLTALDERTVHVLALPAERAGRLPELQRRCRHPTAWTDRPSVAQAAISLEECP